MDQGQPLVQDNSTQQKEPEDREIREFIASAIEEKKRRMAENGIKYYIPLDESKGENDSLGFHQSKARIRAIFGGNRSSKTVSGVCEDVWYATGTHPYKTIPTPNYGRICCTDFTNGIEKVILPEFKRWCPRHMIHHYDVEARTMYLTNGSTVEFMSYDQDVEKFESASRHWIHFDEEPPEDIYKACKMRLLDTRGDMWFTMTPTKGLTWVYDLIYEQAGINPNIYTWLFDSLKNPYLNKEEVEEICKGLDPQEVEARIHGKFVQLSGLIYKEYNPDIHYIPYFSIPQHWTRICSIDPHPRICTVVLYMAVATPQAFIMECHKNNITIPKDFGMDGEDIYVVYDEIYKFEGLLIKDICDLMKAKEGHDYIMYRLIDNSANAPDPIVGTNIKEEFEKYDIRTILADKDVANRIWRVRGRLQAHTLYFMRSCPNTDWEIRHYAWDEYKIGKDYKDPKEKPRKKRDHAMDNLGYMCVSSPRATLSGVYYPKRETVDRDTGY
jgi:phage terminase large subunit-like protein